MPMLSPTRVARTMPLEPTDASTRIATSAPLRRDSPKLRVSKLPDMLKAAHALGLRRRRRVQLPLLGGALVLVSGGVACAVCAAYLRSASSTAHDLLLHGQTLGTNSALPCFLASLQPRDTRAVCAALVVYAAVSLCIGGLNAYSFASMRAQAEATGCGRANLSLERCGWAEILTEMCVLLNALVDVVAALAAMRAAASPLSTRARIKRLWLIAGIAACVLALILLLTIAIRSAAGAYTDQLALLAGSLVLACVYGLNAAFALSGRLRVRVLSCIESEGEAVQRAAVVSALIGGRSVDQALALARGTFRAIRIDALRAADLANSDAETSARLHALSIPVQYGEVDAFVSHSWSDDPAAKWKALSEWGAEFARTHGRPARLWLDSACLDQTEFRSSGSLERVLACLPIYLAGSSRFLVLAGPSWCTRLWCLLEAFVWVQMHGEGKAARGGAAADVNRITVLLLGRNEAERAAVCNALNTLETGGALCSTDAHRALLLEMIEYGFKSLHDFDVALRELLAEELAAAAARECARATMTASERSLSSRERRPQRPSGETQGSTSWRRSLSFRSMLSRPRSPTAGGGRSRCRSAEEVDLEHIRRRRSSTIDGTRSGLTAMLTEPASTDAGRHRRASDEGSSRVSMVPVRESGAYVTGPAAPVAPISTHERRRGSEPARPSTLAQGPARESAGADRGLAVKHAAPAATRDDRPAGTPPRSRRNLAAQHAVMPMMPDLHEDRQAL